MPRLLQINAAEYQKLQQDDECFYIGEYTSGGGFRASETNQNIYNLRKEPSSAPNLLRYKESAIRVWGKKLADHLALKEVAKVVTFVPAPCSKPLGHPEYDDRVLRVVLELNRYQQGLDIRPVLVTTTERRAQHKGDRLSVDELRQSMTVDPEYLRTPLRQTVVVVDDVFTQGGTFKAMKSLLMTLPKAERVVGIFLARTIWPALDPEQPDF